MRAVAVGWEVVVGTSRFELVTFVVERRKIATVAGQTTAVVGR